MDEYITRNRAKSLLICAIIDSWHESYAIDRANEVPAADVLPVVHGKNIGKDYSEVDQFVCSECEIELQGWVRVERDEDTGEETYHEHCFNF